MPVIKTVLRVLLGLVFVGSGVLHFANAPFYVAMMPPYIPFPELMVQLSGVAELVLGVAVIAPKTSRLGAMGLIALLIAVFPANLNMALHSEQFPDFSPMMLYVRLPFQAVFIAWAWVYARRGAESTTRA